MCCAPDPCRAGPTHASQAGRSGLAARSPSIDMTDGGEDDGTLFVALYDYKARTENEMSFQKGDKLRVRSRENENWWEAESLRTRAAGWIPSNYVAKDKSVEKNIWFHGKVGGGGRSRASGERGWLSCLGSGGGGSKQTCPCQRQRVCPFADADSSQHCRVPVEQRHQR